MLLYYRYYLPIYFLEKLKKKKMLDKKWVKSYIFFKKVTKQYAHAISSIEKIPDFFPKRTKIEYRENECAVCRGPLEKITQQYYVSDILKRAAFWNHPPYNQCVGGQGRERRRTLKCLTTLRRSRAPRHITVRTII